MEQNIYKKNDIQQTEENPNRPKFTANFGKLNVHSWLYNKPTIPLKRMLLRLHLKTREKSFFTMLTI